MTRAMVIEAGRWRWRVALGRWRWGARRARDTSGTLSTPFVLVTWIRRNKGVGAWRVKTSSRPRSVRA